MKGSLANPLNGEGRLTIGTARNSVKWLLLVGLTLGLGCATYLLALHISENSRMSTELEELEAGLETARDTLAETEPIDSNESERWKETERALTHLIPRSSDELTLMSGIAELGLTARVRDLTLDVLEGQSQTDIVSRIDGPKSLARGPSDRVTEQLGWNVVRLQASFRCDYQDLATFLDGLARLPRVVEIHSLRILGDAPFVRAVLEVRAYYSES